MAKLTDKERRALNEALAIIERHTAQRASWQICFYRYGSSPFDYDMTYFDSNEGSARGQHSWVRGETFADKVQTALDIESKAAANAEKNRAQRIEQLRRELADLTGEPAADRVPA